MTLVFTEAKRAGVALSTAPGSDLKALEVQLFGYCRQWLLAKRPEGSDTQVYAHAVVGQYIRCFTAQLENNKVIATDQNGKKLIDEQELTGPVLKDDYLDVGNLEDQTKILEHFKKVRNRHPPEPDWIDPFIPAMVWSRPNSSGTGASGRPQTPSERSGSALQGGSPMSVEQQDGSTRSSPADTSRPARQQAVDSNRSASPASPETGSAAQARQRSPLRPRSDE